MNNFTIGIDVDGTKTVYGIFDSNKKLIFKKKYLMIKTKMDKLFSIK